MKLSKAINIQGAQIKNIILDWGGVITDIDIKKSEAAFQKIGLHDFKKHYFIAEQIEFYRLFEEGKMSPDEFRSNLRAYLSLPVSDQEVDNAWTAMLGDTPADRWDLLHEMKKNYRTFLLSNTSILHVESYFDYLYHKFGTRGFRHLFEKVYFSYITGIRKPDTRAFKMVLDENDLLPRETLLVDDSQKNTESARKLGIRVYHLQAPVTLNDLFIPFP
ncbi:MAG: HAD family phosphatase [Bacteroidales bacterium]|nr:HAD family phosphatase [Bacteroidales bacterium]